MKKHNIVGALDYLLLASVLVLVVFGILFIYSSKITDAGVLKSNEYAKQIFFASTGLVLLVAMTILDYRKLRQWSPWIFGAVLLMLLYTCFFGKVVNGARSWLGIGDFGVQPAEFGKIAFILFLARFLENSSKTTELRRFFQAVILMLVPVGLILLQPDLGSAAVYIPVFLVMCYAAGIPKRYLFIVLGIGALTIVMTLLPIWESEIYKQAVPLLKMFRQDEIRLRLLVIICLAIVTLIGVAGFLFIRQRYFYWIAYGFGIVTASLICSFGASKVLKTYQVMRLVVFLNPEVDRLGSGWNIIQSKIAVGSGGFFGKGFLQGTQSHHGFLPEQHTDFIFSILTEEWGFIGGFAVFLLFAIILIRGIIIIYNTTNIYGYYVSMGIVFMVFFHFMVNVGMVMGIMPITGIPLFFLSYGGSSLWTAMLSIGILMSINLRRSDYSEIYRTE